MSAKMTIRPRIRSRATLMGVSGAIEAQLREGAGFEVARKKVLFTQTSASTLLSISSDLTPLGAPSKMNALSRAYPSSNGLSQRLIVTRGELAGLQGAIQARRA